MVDVIKLAATTETYSTCKYSPSYIYKMKTYMKNREKIAKNENNKKFLFAGKQKTRGRSP